MTYLDARRVRGNLPACDFHGQRPILSIYRVLPMNWRWSTNPGIGRSHTVPIYRLINENHSGERFGYIQYIPTLPIRLNAQLHDMTRRRRHGTDWGDKHEEYITIWNNRFDRVPQMDRCLDLQPSPQCLQWYYEKRKPFLFSGQTMNSTPSGSYPPPYSAPSGSYPPPYSTPSSSCPPPYSTSSRSYPPPYSAPSDSYPPPYSAPLEPYLPTFSAPPARIHHHTPLI
ncbi:hypothetical protein J1N35_016896 [Gossypium stocksii]|uniref:Aminotransferase-like plant mobile domain-containing protein n=1 Tax=Gossypium stocksii TaxID=47602 RepID=A0A9D3VLB5_9ROSI|nr:hypothetical protein J1N35_016896 [Gossypium stocksii]